MLHSLVLRAPTQFSNYSVSHYIRGTHYHYLTMSIMRGVLSITEYNVISYIPTVIGTKSVVGSNLGSVYAMSRVIYGYNKWYICRIHINCEHNSYFFML